MVKTVNTNTKKSSQSAAQPSFSVQSTENISASHATFRNLSNLQH